MQEKKRIYEACIRVLEDKMTIARSGMLEAQESANNETKSSAGDKYETGRAMSQNERDRYARQLADLQSQYKVLKSINPDKPSSKVEAGAWVQTANASFFISISLGAIKWEGQSVVAISPISPIAQQLLGKQAGDRFEWMNKSVEILKVS